MMKENVHSNMSLEVRLVLQSTELNIGTPVMYLYHYVLRKLMIYHILLIKEFQLQKMIQQTSYQLPSR